VAPAGLLVAAAAASAGALSSDLSPFALFTLVCWTGAVALVAASAAQVAEVKPCAIPRAL
jgi:hypothetical protein